MNTMPFGRFRGYPITELPNSYLEWLLGLDDLREPLRTQILNERRSRMSHAPEVPRTIALEIDPADITMVREIFEKGYKAASKTYHPDTGGTTAEMQSLNRIASSLRSQLAQLERAA